TPVLGTTTPVFTDTETVGTDSIATGSLAAGSYSFIAVYSGDSNYNSSTGPIEPLTVLAPALTVIKTPDSAIPLNSTDAVGFTITVTNAVGAGTAYGVNLSDPLPAPTGVTWTIATLVSQTAGTNAAAPLLSGN